MALARLHLTLLGGFDARMEQGKPLGLPTKKAQALLAYLAFQPGHAHHRDKLAALLWGESTDARARDSLRHALAALRRALPSPDVLGLEGQTIALAPAMVEVDVAAFEHGVAEGSPAALEAAAALYRGDLLEGVSVSEPAFEDWLLAERERLRELALEALARLLAHQTRADSTERAIQTAARLLALDPLQEAVHRALMRLYTRQGRRAAALRQYQVCVGALQRELGTEPEAETKRLYQEILQGRLTEPPGRPAPSGAPEVEAAPAPPARKARRGAVPARSVPPSDPNPLIGRMAERAQLDRALEEAWRGRGRFVLIVGEAGIGKSRLVDNVGAEAVKRGGRVLVGQAYEMEQVLPFGLWVNALRAGHVIDDADVLERLSPAWRIELARLFPELGLGGLDLPTVHENPGGLFEAIVQVLGHLAARQPLLLVLEDLHWADEMSLRLLGFVARRVRSRAILPVATAREEELVDAPVLTRLLSELDREQHLARLSLSRMSQADTLALVQALAQRGTTASSLDRWGGQVWAASQGNPFMAVETLRALDEGRMPEGADRLPLPRRVHDVIARRFERLSVRTRDLMAVAAVIGEEFDFGVLQGAAGQSEEEAAEGMEELVRRRLLHGVGDRFEFTHDRIREVAYESLLPARRTALHLRVGRTLETVSADRLEEVSDRLAYHYARSEDAAKAVSYLMRFAERATRRYAHLDAVAALDRARARVEELPAPDRDRALIDLVLRQAFSLSVLGRFQEILDLLRRHQAALDRLGDPTRAGPYHFRLGMTYSYLGARARARESGQRALEEARRCADDVTMGQAHYVLALEGFRSTGPRQGVEHGRQAVALLESSRESYWLGLACWIVGLNECLLGHFDQALEAEARVRAIGAALGDARLQSFADWATG